MRTPAGLWWIAVAAGAVLTGCVSTPAAPAADADPAALVEQALAARDSGDYAAFVNQLRQASASCPEPSAASRLDQVAEIAASWSAALLDGRPKVQATTERQLDAVDWTGLAQACAGS